MLTLRSVPDIGRIDPGQDLAETLTGALRRAAMLPEDGDVLVVCSKLLSRAEGRFVSLRDVRPGPVARRLADRIQKDPSLVELVLSESAGVSRAENGVLIVRHRLGFVCANAGIDQSNARPSDAPPDSGPWVLLLPTDPDGSARALASTLATTFGVRLGVVVSDSHGRPFRRGAVGVAIGAAGIPALLDRRGARDLDGRPLEHTETGLADQLASAAELLAGQGAEGRPVTLVRGVGASVGGEQGGASALCRAPEEDLYA